MIKPGYPGFFDYMKTNDSIIIVSTAPGNEMAHNAALQSINKCITLGQAISSIFFYGDAIEIAKTNTEFQSLQQQWITLTNTQNIKLAVCISGALNRHIIDTEEAEIQNVPSNLHPAFLFSSLSVIAEAISESTTILEFGNHDA